MSGAENISNLQEELEAAQETITALQRRLTRVEGGGKESPFQHQLRAYQLRIEEESKKLREANENLERLVKERTEEVKVSEERFALAMRGANDGLWDWNLETDEVYYSPRWKNMLGYDEDELEGNLSTWAALVHQDEQKAILQKVSDYMEGRSNRFEVEMRMAHKEGGWVDVLSRGFMVFSEDSKTPIRLVGTHVDITDLKKLESQFIQSQKMESIGVLVGGIAHEFNNTLAGITGRLYLARNCATNNPDIIRHIDKISLLSERSSEMVQQLLAFSRKSPVQMKTFDLTAFVQETFNLHRFSIPESIDIDTHFSHYALPIYGDATQIQQILVNLLHNARDAVENVRRPSINVSLEMFEADASFKEAHADHPETHYAHLIVEDNGCGIFEMQREKIFDPFFTTKDVGKGTGLGLAMVYGAIQTHQGIIQVVSEVNQGTRMNIYIPLTSSTLLDSQQEDSQSLHGSGECILLVDDEAELRGTGREVLELLGYTILEAGNGNEAIETYIANEHSIALTILDVVMPKMGGLEAAQRIKAHNQNAKIIFCTGYDKEDVLDDRILADCVVITKPYNIEELSHLIRQQLSPT